MPFRTMQGIEKAKQYIDDCEGWHEKSEKALWSESGYSEKAEK